MKDHVPEGWREGGPRTQGAVRPKLDPWKETIPEITKGPLRKTKDFLKNAVVKSKDVDKYESVNKEIQEFNNAISMIQGHQSDFSSEEQTKYNDLFQKFYNATKKAINSFGDMTSPLGREERQKARRDLKKFNNTIKAVKFELCWAKLQNSSTIDEAFPELAEELTSRFSLNLDQKSQLQQLPELWRSVNEGLREKPVEKYQDDLKLAAKGLKYHTRNAFESTTNDERRESFYALLTVYSILEYINSHSIFEETR